MNQSVIKHKASMYYVPFHEDFLLISKACTFKKLNKNGKPGNASPYCKAFILAILENWTNEKRDKGEELSIYMSYPQWVDAMYGMFGRNVIIDSIDELIGERLISREPYKMFGRDSFQYRLNDQELNKRIKALPDDPFKNKRVAFRNKPDTSLKVNGDQFKSKRNIESTQTPNIESTEESTSTVAASPAGADAHTHSPSSSQSEKTSSQKQLTHSPIASPATATEPTPTREPVTIRETQQPCKPRAKKPAIDEITQKRVDAVYLALDEFKRKATGNPEEKYQRHQIDTDAIVNVLLPQNPTSRSLFLVCKDMWNQKDRDGKHFWRKNMKPHNICNEYESRIMGLEGKDVIIDPDSPSRASTTVTGMPRIMSAPDAPRRKSLPREARR